MGGTNSGIYTLPVRSALLYPRSRRIVVFYPRWDTFGRGICCRNDQTVVIHRLASIVELTDTIYQFLPTRQHKRTAPFSYLIFVQDGFAHTDYFLSPTFWFLVCCRYVYIEELCRSPGRVDPQKGGRGWERSHLVLFVSFCYSPTGPVGLWTLYRMK